jgi:hypothetical protein
VSISLLIAMIETNAVFASLIFAGFDHEPNQ